MLTEAQIARRREILVERNFRHGLRRHPLYPIWLTMKARCDNPRSKDFKDYGGRGIRVCSEWSGSFKEFHDWAVSGYAKGLYIDRIDTEKGYAPENCRFVTPTVSANNKRNNKRYEFSVGNFLTCAEAGRKYGIPGHIIRQRMYTTGLSPSEAVRFRIIPVSLRRR